MIILCGQKKSKSRENIFPNLQKAGKAVIIKPISPDFQKNAEVCFLKRLLSVLLVLSLLTGLAGCAGTEEIYSVTVEGAVFGGRNDDSIDEELKFDIKWMTRADNTKYNNDLAAFCALFCADSYYLPEDADGGALNRVLFRGDTKPYSYESFLTNLGFTEVSHIEPDPSAGGTDADDSVSMTIGHRTVNGRYDAYAVVFRGCYSPDDWVSAFDAGSDSEAYAALTGEHPDWLDHDHIKGTDVTAQRVMRSIDAFMKEHNDPSLADCLLLTGHSRGGAVANILGAAYEKRPGVRTYTYTFNALPVTLAKDAKSYRTIFNIFDNGDFYTEPLPFSDEIFSRYGTDMRYFAADSLVIKEAIAELKDREDYDSISENTKNEYKVLFGRRFPDRASLYETVTFDRSYELEAEAAARFTEYGNLIGADGLDLGSFCRIRPLEKAADGSFTLTMEYCGAALLIGYARILSFGEPAYDKFVSLFNGDEAGQDIAELLFDNLPALTSGHLLANTYILTEDIK